MQARRGPRRSTPKRILGLKVKFRVGARIVIQNMDVKRTGRQVEVNLDGASALPSGTVRVRRFSTEVWVWWPARYKTRDGK